MVGRMNQLHSPKDEWVTTMIGRMGVVVRSRMETEMKFPVIICAADVVS